MNQSIDIRSSDSPQTLLRATTGLPGPARRHRGGATLLEVLMAMIVMAIGVLSAATLFPISILRAVEAAKLTNATVLRYNAEALNDIKNFVRDPDNDTILNNHYNVTYVTNGPDDQPGDAGVDDDGMNGVDDAGELGTLGTDDTNHYLVDPLGAIFVGQEDINYQTNFGNVNLLDRFHFNLTADLPTAEALFAHADSWNSQVNGIATTFTPTSATLDGTVDLSGISTTLTSRVILIDESGVNSLTRTISSIAGQVINWTTALPASFTPATARVETFETRNFTWMLTVRTLAAADIQADVVVFFRRPFGTTDERVFSSTAGELAELADRVYQVTYNPNTDPRYWRRGGFLLDVENARWYRILKVEDDESGTALLTLEQKPKFTIRDAAFMRNIVDVYPLGNKAL